MPMPFLQSAKHLCIPLTFFFVNSITNAMKTLELNNM
jgi:hypothetical protein